VEHYELSFRRRIASAEKGLRIFISYRRDDTAGYAGWLAERLGNRHRVFIDVDSIGIGADFVPEIEES
jgi:hypothetical protein